MKKTLNKNGWKKLLEYLREEHPKLVEKMKIEGDHVVLDGQFHLVCLVEAEVPMVPPEKAEPGAEMPIGSSTDETPPKIVGRAGVEKEREQQVADVVKKVAKDLPTSAAVKKKVAETETDVEKLSKAVQSVAQQLKVK